MIRKEKVQKWIIRALNDPIVKILYKNSHLTKIQLETLLIDLLSENIYGKSLKYDEKAQLRLRKSKITRGSFSRTLKQAKKNSVQAIYTILLLGYLGVFESSSLRPYLEIANRLSEYIEAYKNTSSERVKPKERLKVIREIREELKSKLKELSNT